MANILTSDIQICIKIILYELNQKESYFWLSYILVLGKDTKMCFIENDWMAHILTSDIQFCTKNNKISLYELSKKIYQYLKLIFYFFCWI